MSIFNTLRREVTDALVAIPRIASALERIAAALEGEGETRTVAQSLDALADCTAGGDYARSFSVDGSPTHTR